MKNNIFEDLFVLEIANNHWGNLERGKKIKFCNGINMLLFNGY